MFRRAAIACCLFVLLPGTAEAAPPEGLNAAQRKAYATVAETGSFCGVEAGEGGAPTVIYAFRALLQSAHADATFKELLLEATQPGKIYALCGLYHTDPLHFEKVVELYRHSDEPVNVLFGCSLYTMTMGEIVEKKEGPAAVWRRDRKRSYAAWRKEAQARNLGLDVLNGGWPAVLVEAKLPAR